MAERYNFTDADFLLIAQGEQTFVKKAYPPYQNRAKYGRPYPFNCTAFPWDDTNQVLLTDSLPGSEDAICSINPYYCESEDHIKDFFALYLSNFQSHSQVRIQPCWSVDRHGHNSLALFRSSMNWKPGFWKWIWIHSAR
jgi:hypothetical protein